MAGQRFLIVNYFGIGDVLFTIPIIKCIRARVPGAMIGFFCNRRTAALLEKIPLIDKVIVYDRDEFRAIYKKSRMEFIRGMKKLLCAIKADCYDVAIDLSLHPAGTYFAKLTGIPQCKGYVLNRIGRLLTDKIPLDCYTQKPVVDYYFDVLKMAGIEPGTFSMEIPVPESFSAGARDYLKKKGVPSDARLVAMAPGGGESWGREARFKQWPAEKFAVLADKIIANLPAEVILVGGHTDENLCRDIVHRVGRKIYSACGETSLMEAMALLKECRLAVVNDGGPLHMAVAAGTPTVSIFGPVNEKVYGPYPLSGHRVVTSNIACRPCYRNFRIARCDHISCLSRIEVGDVFEKIREAMNLPPVKSL